MAARRASGRSREARPAIRRDADGEVQAAPTWESLVERLIREAQDAGRFDALPGHGRPLALDDDSAAGEMALAYRVLRNARISPPWIEADKEVRARQASIEALLEAATTTAAMGREGLALRLAELADAHDLAVARLASLAPSPRQHRRPLDRTVLRERLDAALRRP
jgi:hypothetical protein